MHLLMCPPTFFGIEYAINPWMNVAVQAVHGVAKQQWKALYDALIIAGARVELLAPMPGLPDLVFTANAGLVFGNRVVLSQFRHPQRQGETPLDRAWFQHAGFEVLDPPPGLAFEGAGDALFCGDTLVAGYRQRSDATGHVAIGQMLGVRTLPVELVNPHYYHLDTCFCPLAPDLAIWYPAAFDDYGQRAIRNAVATLIDVDADEAAHFACNAVVLGKQVFTNTGCPKLHSALRKHDFEPIATPLGEFVKAGGSAKCLTLRLDGEKALNLASI